MKDIHGDKITVSSSLLSNTIGINFRYVDFDDAALFMALTPEKARKLARKINRHASRIEIAERGR